MKFYGTRVSKIESNALEKRAKEQKTSSYQLIRKLIQKEIKENRPPITEEELSIEQIRQEKEEEEARLWRIIKTLETRIEQKEQDFTNISKIFNISDENNIKLLKEIFEFATKHNREHDYAHLSEAALDYAIKFLYP